MASFQMNALSHASMALKGTSIQFHFICLCLSSIYPSSKYLATLPFSTLATLIL